MGQLFAYFENSHGLSVSAEEETTDEIRTLILRSTIKHEVIHLLADDGDLKIPVEWETLTWAFDVMERVKQLSGGRKWGDLKEDGRKTVLEKLQTFSAEFGEPALAGLFEAGLGMGEEGSLGFIIHPGVSDHKAGYFFIEPLILKAREIYQQNKLNPNPLQDKYSAQRAAAIMIGAALTTMKETKDSPFEEMRRLLELLYELYAPPTPEDLDFAQKLEAELMQQYMRPLVGRGFTYEQMREEGLWNYNPESHQLRYHWTDFFPRKRDGQNIQDQAGQREAAYRRVHGQALWAFHRALKTPEVGNDSRKESLEFSLLWETLWTPYLFAILAGKTGGKAVADDRAVLWETSQEKYLEGGPAWVASNFRERYALEDYALLRKARLASLRYPHLMYLDSLRYRFVLKKSTDDRVERKDVLEALQKTEGDFAGQPGWARMMIGLEKNDLASGHAVRALADQALDFIWSEYLKLYEASLKQEGRELLQKQLQDQEINESNWQAIWNALPQAMQQALAQQAQQNVQQGTQQFANFSPQALQMPQQTGGGQQGQVQPGQPAGGTAAAAQSLQNLAGQLSSLQAQLAGLQQQLTHLPQQLQDIQQGAGHLSQQTGQPNPGQQLSEQAGKLQDNASAALNSSQEIQDSSHAIQQGAQTMAQQSPGTPQAAEGAEQASSLNQQAADLTGDAINLQSLANQIKQKIKELLDRLPGKDTGQLGTLPQQIQNVQALLNQMNNVAEAMKNQAQNMASSSENLDEILKDVKTELEALNHALSKVNGGKPQAAPQPAEGSSPGAPGIPQNQKADLAPLLGLDDLIPKGEISKPQPPKEYVAKPVSVIGAEAMEAHRKALQRLTPEQQAEYDRWLQTKMTDFDGNVITLAEVIEQGDRFFEILLARTLGFSEKTGLRDGDIDDIVTDLISGKGKKRGDFRDAPELLLVTLVDGSGSMFGPTRPAATNMHYAQMTVLVLISVLLRHNVMRQKAEPKLKPHLFETGVFSDASELIFDAGKGKEVDEATLPYYIYHALKDFEKGGGTRYSQSYKKFIEHLKAKAKGAEKNVLPVLVTITDEDVLPDQMSDVLAASEGAAQDGIFTLNVPLDDRWEIPEGREQFVLSLSKFGASKDQLPLVLITYLMSMMADKYHLHEHIPTRLKHWIDKVKQTRAEARSTNETRLIPGYKYFHYETLNGREYLVYQDAYERRQWQAGPGGPRVPEKTIAMNEENEEMLFEILKKAYPYQGEYQYVSKDNLFFIRQADKDGIELFSRASVEDYWQSRKIIYPRKMEQGGLYRTQDDDYEYQYVPQPKRLLIFSKGGEKLLHDLKIDHLQFAEASPKKIFQIEGFPGVGKGVLEREVAKLLRIPYFSISSHNRIMPSSIPFTRSMDKTGHSGYDPAAYTEGLHYGALINFDEAHKLSKTAINSLKSDTPVGRHLFFYVQEDGTKVDVSVPNHPYARVFFTTNPMVNGIEGSEALEDLDPAAARRIEPIHVFWQAPDQEEKRLYTHALQFAQENQLAVDDAKIRNVIHSLVDLAANLRLIYAGYGDRERRKALKMRLGKYPDWKKVLRTPGADPVASTLLRAPSPRILQKVIEHLLRYPKDLEKRTGAILKRFYNFYAERDKNNASGNFVHTQITDRKTELPFGADTSLMLDPEKSFNPLPNGMLEIQPLDAAGNPHPDFDVLTVPLHAEASMSQPGGYLPEEFQFMLLFPQNHPLIYQVLQARAAGFHALLVGEHGSGKSTLALALQKLVGGEGIYFIPMYEGRSVESLFFQQETGDGKVGLKTSYRLGPIPRAMIEGKPAAVDEINQADSETNAPFNDLLSSGEINNAGENKLYTAAPGFWFLGMMNRPGKYDVHDQSAEWFERFVIFEVQPLPAGESVDFMGKYGRLGERQINPKLMGLDVAVDAAGNPEWKGFGKLMIELRNLSNQEKIRAVDVGTLGQFAARIMHHFEGDLRRKNRYFEKILSEFGFDIRSTGDLLARVEQLLKDQDWLKGKQFEDEDGGKTDLRQLLFEALVKPQDLLLEYFYEVYSARKEDEKTAIREAFKNAGIWSEASENKDALLEFLQGEDVIVEKLPHLRKPDSGNPDLDRVLMYVQENISGLSIDHRFDELSQRWIPAVFQKNVRDWEKLPFDFRLKNFAASIEIHRILGYLLNERSDPSKGKAFTPERVERMKTIRSTIEDALGFEMGRGWPEHVLAQAENKEFGTQAELAKWLEKYAASGQKLSAFSADPVKQDLAARLYVFGGAEAVEYTQAIQAELLIHTKKTQRAKVRSAKALGLKIGPLKEQLTDGKNVLAVYEESPELFGQRIIDVQKSVVNELEQDLASLEARLSKAGPVSEYEKLLAKLREELARLTAKLAELQAQPAAQNLAAQEIRKVATAGPFTLPAGDILRNLESIQEAVMPDGKDLRGYLTQNNELKIWQWDGTEWKSTQEFNGVEGWDWRVSDGNIVVDVRFTDGRPDEQIHFEKKEESAAEVSGAAGVERAKELEVWELKIAEFGAHIETLEKLAKAQEERATLMPESQSRSELRRRTSSVSHAAVQNQRIQRELREAWGQVSLNSMAGIFSLDLDPERRQQAILILRQSRPEFFEEKRPAAAFAGLLRHPDFFAGDSAGIARIYSSLPDDADLDLLRDLAARNPQSQILVMLPEKEKGRMVFPELKNILVTTNLQKIEGFAKAHQERLFVYGENTEGMLQRLEARFHEQPGRRLFITDDLRVGAHEILENTAALLAGLDLFFSDDPVPSLVQSAWALFSRRLELLDQARRLLAQAA